MALISKNNPVGVDALIGKFQSRLWDYLPNFQANWDSYPRVYRNPKNKRGAYTFEHFDNGDYQDVLMNDKQPLTTFWYEVENRDVNPSKRVESTLRFYVQCADLNVFFPNVNHRADEELVNTLYNYFKRVYNSELNIVGIVKGVDNVFNDIVTSGIRYEDMNEFFIFRIDFDAKYNFCDC